MGWITSLAGYGRKPEHLVEVGQVRRALGGLELGEQDQCLHRGLECACLGEHGLEAMQELGVTRQPVTDLGRSGLPHRGQLIEQGGRHERLVVVDRVGDPAGDRRPDPVARAARMPQRRYSASSRST